MSTAVTHLFDHEPAVYAPGETIMLTVMVAPHDPDPVQGTVRTTTVIMLPDGTESDPVVVESPYTVDAKPGTARTQVLNDSTGRSWTKVSDTGNDSTFRTVA